MRSSLTKSAAAAPTCGARAASTLRSPTESKRALGPANSRTTGAPRDSSTSPHDVSEPASQELERDVARADEGAEPPCEEHLHAHRRANEHGSVRERLGQRGRRDDQREHPDAADAREARVVGDAQPRGAREPLEVHGRRKTDAGARHEDAVREHLRRRGAHRLAGALVSGDAARVVRDRDLGGGLLQARGHRLREGAAAGARASTI